MLDREEDVWLMGHLLVGAKVCDELALQLCKRVDIPWLKVGVSDDEKTGFFYCIGSLGGKDVFYLILI